MGEVRGALKRGFLRSKKLSGLRGVCEVVTPQGKGERSEEILLSGSVGWKDGMAWYFVGRTRENCCCK